MSELSMGEEGLGLKPGLAELKLEPGIHRFVAFSESNLSKLLRDGDVEPMVETPHTAARKSDKIRQIVNEHTSAESQKTVESILDQVLYQCGRSSYCQKFITGLPLVTIGQIAALPEIAFWSSS